MTLWHIPAELEDQFDMIWHDWLDQVEAWRPFFEAIALVPGSDLLAYLSRLGLVSQTTVDEVRPLKRSAENRAVAIPGSHSASDELFELLAAAFSKSDVGALAVPYARLEG